MPYFAVFNEPGPVWDHTRPMRQQDGWAEHAAFMDRLVDEGFVRLGGPLGDGQPHRAMLIVEADSMDAVRARLAEDPWVPMRVLSHDHVEPWEVLLGAVPAS